jgi:hypothetical protein
MRNIIILCTVLLIAITALASKYFSALAGKDNNLSTVLNFTPADAAFVLSFKNDQSFFEIFKDYQVFDAIIGDEQLQELNLVKNLLNHPAFAEVTIDKNIFISCHIVSTDAEFLYSMNLDPQYLAENLHELFLKLPDATLKGLSPNVYRLNFKSYQKPFYVFIQKGAVIGSFSNTLLQTCLHEKSARLNKTFVEEIVKTSTKNLNSPVNLFINHSALPAFISHFNRSKSPENLSLISELQGFSSLSMNFKSDALMFNGLSSTEVASKNYLNLFLNQKPVQNDIKKVLPENTSNFIAFGMSDVKTFRSDLKDYLNKRNELKKLEEQFQRLQNSTGVSPERDIKPFFDKEFVLIENSYGESFALIKVTNGRNINSKLQLISNPYNEIVSQLNYGDLFYYYFGEPLKSFQRPYFGVVDNYLIIANTPGIISNYISNYENDRFLVNTNQFKDYDQLVANQSNILYFVSRKNFKRLASSKLKPKYAVPFSQEDRFNKFYGFSYQWTSDGDHFFTNLYLSYNSTDSLALN